MNLDAVDEAVTSSVFFARLQELTHKLADPLLNWGFRYSTWWYLFGLKCCAIEMMSFFAARFDAERLGTFFSSTPRRADLMFVTGPVTKKMAPRLKLLYEQMPCPKYVIAIGECAICGGPWFESYSVIQGVDKIVPVDMYVPGCPPRPEQFIESLQKLHKDIKEKGLRR
jgi:NADH-quinone oxidoreductase subunit B